MVEKKEKFYPGKRVEVWISLSYGSCWFRGTVTEPRTPYHQGKVRVWFDQLPFGWTTFEIILPVIALSGQLIRPLNQPDRIITPLWELNSIFYFSAPVLVTDGIQSQEGAVIKPPTDESPNIKVRLFEEGEEKEITYDPLLIERVYNKKKDLSLSCLRLV